MSRERDPYKVVGEATRAAIVRALEADAPTHALRVLLAIIGEVALWSRLEAPVSRGKLARVTGMSERMTRLGVRWLDDHGVIDWTPGGSDKGGHRYLSRASFPARTGVTTDPRSYMTPGSPERRDRGTERVTTGVTTGPRNEKVEKNEGPRATPNGAAAPHEVDAGAAEPVLVKAPLAALRATLEEAGA